LSLLFNPFTGDTEVQKPKSENNPPEADKSQNYNIQNPKTNKEHMPFSEGISEEVSYDH
jgi:hypothetical protein